MLTRGANSSLTSLQHQLCLSYKTNKERPQNKGLNQRLQVAYNDALRMLLKRPRWTGARGLFVSAGVNTLQAVLRNVMHRFICWLNDSENQNVVAMVNIMYSDTRCTSPFWGIYLFIYLSIYLSIIHLSFN